jgi:HK97 family phage major capsid protein
MNKIVELKEQRNTKIQEMEAITAKMEAEGRAIKDTEERTAWNDLKSSVEELEGEIQDAEFAAARNIEIVTQEMKQETKEDKELRNYDLAKALREYKNGKLEGFEKEMQEEGEQEYKRFGANAQGLVIPAVVMRSITKAGNASHMSEIANPSVDVVADRGILAKLGVTSYEGLTAALKLTFSDGFNAAFYGEGVTESTTAPTEASGKLEAKRIQGSQNFSNEFLAQSATMPALIADMLMSIEAATAKKIFDDIIADAATTLTGYGSAATAKVLTYKDVLKLKGALKTAAFVSPKLVSGGELYSELEGTTKDAGGGRFVIEAGKFNGYDAVDAMGLIVPATSKHSLVFGDFSKAHVGYFGGIEILVDPFTAAKKGETVLTYHRLGDVSHNPKGFKTIQNASVA